MKNYTFQWDTWYPSLFAVCTFFFSPNETNFIVSLFYNKYRFEETAGGRARTQPNPLPIDLFAPSTASYRVLSNSLVSFHVSLSFRSLEFDLSPTQHHAIPTRSFNPIPSYANRSNFWLSFSFRFSNSKIHDRGIIYAISKLESVCTLIGREV